MKTSHLFFAVRVVGAVLTASVLLAGCKQNGSQIQNKVGQIMQQAGNAILTESDLSGIKDPLVRKNFVAQANARSYRVVTSSSGKTEGTTTTEIQLSGAQVSFHTLTQVGGKIQEMIVIGDTTYVKNPTTGTWWKQTTQSDQTQANTPASFKVPTVDEIKQEFTKKQTDTEFKSLGTENCGSGLTCYKYQEVDSGDVAGVRTFWFDTQSYLTRKDEQKLGGFTTTNVYSYDNINIVAPSPTKEVPVGHSVFEYMM